MKMKKLKGFTLIECIVAIALIGIITVYTIPIFESIVNIRRNNLHTNNTLNAQMAMVEQEAYNSGSDIDVSVMTNYQTKPGDNKFGDKSVTMTNQSNIKFDLKFRENTANSNVKSNDFKSINEIKAEIDVIVYKIDHSKNSNDKYDETVRYKFLRSGEYKNT